MCIRDRTCSAHYWCIYRFWVMGLERKEGSGRCSSIASLCRSLDKYFDSFRELSHNTRVSSFGIHWTRLPQILQMQCPSPWFENSSDHRNALLQLWWKQPEWISRVPSFSWCNCVFQSGIFLPWLWLVQSTFSGIYSFKVGNNRASTISCYD